MRNFMLACVLSTILFAAAPSKAHAWGWPLFGRSYSSSYYYYPTHYSYPVYSRVVYYNPPRVYYPVVRYVDPCPPVSYARALAPQSPAPPSTPRASNPEPEPINSYPKKPRVTESRASLYFAGSTPPKYDTYYSAGKSVTDSAANPKTCTITFWNLTGAGKSLNVNGSALTLTAGKQITLTLPRQVSWQLAGHDAVNTTVAMEERGVEIVLRK